MTATFGSTLFLEELFSHNSELKEKAFHEGTVLCLAAGAGNISHKLTHFYKLLSFVFCSLFPCSTVPCFLQERQRQFPFS